MNERLLELFDSFKVVVYVPISFKEDFFTKMLKIQFNKIGEYTNCASWLEVESTWTATNKAKPYIGRAGECSIEKEIRYEFYCAKSDIERVVRYIKDIHPYETAEIDIIPMSFVN